MFSSKPLRAMAMAATALALAGGSYGIADPRARTSIGYAMNMMGAGAGFNSRGQSLVDAVYVSLGYTTNAPGAWIKEG